jgi:flagellar basal-body rod protein FlgC
VLFESLLPAPTETQSAQSGLAGVRVAKIFDDPSPLQKIHMPGHPHADAEGMVTLPNVNVVEEMVDMMTASRSYEANLQVLHSAKQIFTNSMRIVES